jgi:hypothetical protein
MNKESMYTLTEAQDWIQHLILEVEGIQIELDNVLLDAESAYANIEELIGSGNDEKPFIN